MEVTKMNFFNKKNQQRMAAVICVVLVIAMILPLVLQYLAK